MAPGESGYLHWFWQDLIWKMGALLDLHGFYQTYLVLQKTGLQFTPVLIFEVFGVGETAFLCDDTCDGLLRAYDLNNIDDLEG